VSVRGFQAIRESSSNSNLGLSDLAGGLILPSTWEGLLNSTSRVGSWLRYDFGDTIIHYNSSTITVSGQTIPSPGEVRNNFQFSTAIAFRF